MSSTAEAAVAAVDATKSEEEAKHPHIDEVGKEPKDEALIEGDDKDETQQPLETSDQKSDEVSEAKSVNPVEDAAAAHTDDAKQGDLHEQEASAEAESREDGESKPEDESEPKADAEVQDVPEAESTHQGSELKKTDSTDEIEADDSSEKRLASESTDISETASHEQDEDLKLNADAEVSPAS